MIVSIIAHGFFLGPSCNAPGCFCPTIAFVGEYLSSGIRIRVVVLEWRAEQATYNLYKRTEGDSTLHSPTGPSGVRADCTDSLGLRTDSVRTPYDFGCPHKNCTMRELNQVPGTNSHLQGGTLYHCAIVACYTYPTCASYVTCGLIGKCVSFYSI